MSAQDPNSTPIGIAPIPVRHPSRDDDPLAIERSSLTLGELSDDGLAEQLHLVMTASKERIRWLSRKLRAAHQRITQLEAAVRALEPLAGDRRKIVQRTGSDAPDSPQMRFWAPETKDKDEKDGGDHGR